MDLLLAAVKVSSILFRLPVNTVYLALQTKNEQDGTSSYG